ncbi:MAG: hypothetical protein L6Q57_01595 [Alphaproteobacteria bacterium]|nr:hypothetical protein [Alphaproteobacteria bacterium]
MKINIKEFLAHAGITEPFYPGKRLVHACRQPGEFKSHCVVLDWRDPARVRIEIKAGLNGRDLEPKQLKNYPVSFQSPTFVDIEFDDHTNLKNKEEEEGDSKGRASGGGKKPAMKKNLEEMRALATQAFGAVREGKIPELGLIAQIVVMGTKIAKEAHGSVMETLAHQIQHAKIAATDLLAHAGKYITRYTPPGFLKPTGDEDKVYRYDREKNADIGFRPSLSV